MTYIDFALIEQFQLFSLRFRLGQIVLELPESNLLHFDIVHQGFIGSFGSVQTFLQTSRCFPTIVRTKGSPLETLQINGNLLEIPMQFFDVILLVDDGRDALIIK